jgi:hypothetical protein
MKLLTNLSPAVCLKASQANSRLWLMHALLPNRGASSAKKSPIFLRSITNKKSR